MSVHYLVTAYGNQQHLLRLLRRLTEAAPAGISLQWDGSKAGLSAEVQALGVDVIRPVAPVEWGDGSYLDALLRSMYQLPTSDWVVVLSGQDYPIRPVSAFQEMLSNAAFDGILHLAAVDPPGQMPWTDDQRRYYFRHFWIPRWLWRSTGGAEGIGRAIQATARLPVIRRRAYFRSRPRNLPGAVGLRVSQDPFSPTRSCRKGADYFALRRELVEELLVSTQAEPALLQHFRRSAIPTEGWFGTVLGHHGDRLLGEVLHFTRFEGRSSPRILEDSDLKAAQASGKYFARKFSDESHAVTNVIDAEFLRVRV